MLQGTRKKVCASNYRCRLHSGHKIYITNYNIQTSVCLHSLHRWGQLTSKNNLIFRPLSLLRGILTRRSKYVRKMKVEKGIQIKKKKKRFLTRIKKMRLLQQEEMMAQMQVDGRMRSTTSSSRLFSYTAKTGTECTNMLAQGPALKRALMLRSISTN